MDNDVYRFELGDFACMVVCDNDRVMSLSQVFPHVSTQELQRALRQTAQDSDEITVGFNCLFIDTGPKKVLVDTGTGQGQLVPNLATAGVAPESIDTVILTHGDRDHIGGVRDFPNARFVLTKDAWASWTQPEQRAVMVEQFIKLFRGTMDAQAQQEAAQQREAFGKDVLPSLQDRVDLVEPEAEFMPGFRLVSAPGHRSDHTAVEVRSKGAALLHVADAIRHPLQAAHPDWASFIDADPKQVGATNRRLLQRAVQHDALVFSAHMMFPGLMRVRAANVGWQGQAIGP